MTNKTQHKRLLRRGFNLIEIAIVVVVLGILGSAVLVPLTATLIEDQYDREEIAIERAKQAVIGYAARSSTPGVTVDFQPDSQGRIGAAIEEFVIPAGRAYFPCPDITGDGHEDRIYFGEFGVQIDPIMLDNGEILIDAFNLLNNNNNNFDLKTAGACASMRGFLPWKTLGLPSDDVWGNLYTYGVDYAYSHGLVGFNKNTIADEFTAHDLATEDANGNLILQRRGVVRGRIPNLNNGRTTRNEALPIGLCLGIGSPCGNDKITSPTLTLAFGDRADAAAANPVGNRTYMANDLRDGLIFVIVSHGRNGFRAGRLTGGDANAIPPTHFTCNGLPAGTSSNIRENTNAPFVDLAITMLPNICNLSTATNLHSRLFAVMRRNNFDTNTTFDDVMVWATREEINEVITRDSPDLPLFVPRCPNHAANPPRPCP